MKVNKLIELLNQRFPLYLQEKYDNAGEQVLFGNDDIKSILLSLDLDADVIGEAVDMGANLIITHHPFFFKPLRRITDGDPASEMLLQLIEKKISLYSAHTNLDKIYFDKLGEVLEVGNRELLIKTDQSRDAESEDYGFGVYGELQKAVPLEDILKTVKEKLKLDFVIYSGSRNTVIKRIALAGGAGGGMIEGILKERELDCIITGDIGYHPCKVARDYGVPVIDAGHYGTEKILLNFLKDEIEDCLTKFEDANDVNIFISKKEENPFKVYL